MTSGQPASLRIGSATNRGLLPAVTGIPPPSSLPPATGGLRLRHLRAPTKPLHHSRPATPLKKDPGAQSPWKICSGIPPCCGCLPRRRSPPGRRRRRLLLRLEPAAPPPALHGREQGILTVDRSWEMRTERERERERARERRDHRSKREREEEEREPLAAGRKDLMFTFSQP